MHFVAALDRVDGMRCVLGVFEGVVTGAADGYGRMLDRPAATLLHLGPGLANGLSNLHNAGRANSPVVNIIGDHATYHRHLDAPLTSDIEGTARPFSSWVRTSPNAEMVAADGAAALPPPPRGGRPRGGRRVPSRAGCARRRTPKWLPPTAPRPSPPRSPHPAGSPR